MKRMLPLLFLLCTSSALANDTAMGGRGASLVPLQTSDVYMASEDITLTFEMKGPPEKAGWNGMRPSWHADARYEFVNPGATPVELQFGFPEYQCELTGSDAEEFCPSAEVFHFK